METFQRDTEYIIRQAGLETLLLNKVPKTNDLKITNRSSKNDTAALLPKWVKNWLYSLFKHPWLDICATFSRYFSQIDEDILKQIIEIYQLDFDLFNYDSSKYLTMVQKSVSKKFNDVNNRLDLGDDGSESKIFS